MDRKEHAAHLRRALAQAGLQQIELADALGVSKRTVVNWVSRDQPMMPTEKMQLAIGRLLPGYDRDGSYGDPVESAIARSGLAPFRQAEMVAVYKRLQHEQAREDASTG